LTREAIIDNDIVIDNSCSKVPVAIVAHRLRPLKSESLTVQVAATLRSAIFSGELAPGQPLRELHLARDLGVSQATVREALGQLERFGLVVRTPNIGTQVTRLSWQDVRERVELRQLLEERAMLQAAPRMDAAAFEALAVKLDALTDAIRRNAYFEEAQADLAFHRFIWEQSGNRTLYHTLDQLAVPLFAFVSILRGAHRQNLTEVVQSHEGIVQALRAGEAGVISEALRQHFEYGFSIPKDITGELR
jgi:DNA-binding GntR family transcriptional regulator